MNLLIFDDSDIEASSSAVDRERAYTISVRDYRHTHLRDVCKAQVGETFQVGLLNGGKGEGRVVSSEADQTVLAVELTESAEEVAKIDLVLALPRPQMLKRILENVAALGVRRLALIRSVRVEKSYFSSPVLEADEIARHIRLGLEQSKTTRAPVVTIHPTFREFMEKDLAEFYAEVRVLAEEEASQTLNHISATKDAEMTLVVGPEGGFVRTEREEFEHRGFVPVRLCDRVLRVETAVYALIAQVHLMRAIWVEQIRGSK